MLHGTQVPNSAVGTIFSGLYIALGLAHLPFDSFTDLSMLQLFGVMGLVRKQAHAVLQYPLMVLACIKACKVIVSIASNDPHADTYCIITILERVWRLSY